MVFEGRPLIRAEKKRAAFADMCRIDDGLESLVSDLISTGTETGKHQVRELLEMAVDAISDTQRSKDYKDTWEHRCRHVLGDAMRVRMTCEWSAGNVAEEVGHSAVSGVLSQDADYAHHALQGGIADKVPSYEIPTVTDRSYWRGMAALARCTDVDEEGEDFHKHGMKFVEWAGKRGDLREIISMSKERNTLDPDALQSLLEAKQHHHGSLSDGII